MGLKWANILIFKNVNGILKDNFDFESNKISIKPKGVKCTGEKKYL